MANACVINPLCTTPDGKEKQSILYQKLKDIAGRPAATKTYINAMVDYVNQDNIRVDKNGQPTLANLLANTNAYDTLGTRKVLAAIAKECKFSDKEAETIYKRMTNDEVINRLEEASKFNSESEYSDSTNAFVVTRKNIETGENEVGIQLERTNEANKGRVDRQNAAKSLNEKLTEILNSHGIAVGELTNIEAKIGGINGVTEFGTAKRTAQGFIELIRIAKGEKGAEALPEEFAHTAIRACINDSMVQRLINLIKNENLVESILGSEYNRYLSEYNGNYDMLVEEAAGKVLAAALRGEQLPVQVNQYKSFLQRVIDTIKKIFSKVSAENIENAVAEAQLIADAFANRVKANEVTWDNKELEKEYKLLQVAEEELTTAQKVFEKLRLQEEKRFYIERKRLGKEDSEYVNLKEGFLNELFQKIEDNNYAEALTTYMVNTIKELKTMQEELSNLDKEHTSQSGSKYFLQTWQKAKVLRRQQDTINSYLSIYNTLLEALETQDMFSEENQQYKDKIQQYLNNIYSSLALQQNKVSRKSTEYIIPLFEGVSGPSITIPFGKHKGEVITVRSLFTRISNDIGFLDKWFSSMSNSNNWLLNLFDKIVKERKETARIRTIDVQQRIQRMLSTLEQHGIKNQDWMYEKDEDGNLTGSYVLKYNYTKFQKDKREFLASLDEKYGTKNLPDHIKLRKHKEAQQWYFDHTVKDESGRRVPTANYINTAYTALMADPIKAQFYREFMRIKAQMDSYLPKGATKIGNTIKIRKDVLERVKESEGVRGKASSLWESVKDQVMNRSDEADLGYGVQDFSGHIVRYLPIYYIRQTENESPNDISTDACSTLLAYANMAIEYNEMEKVADILELANSKIQNSVQVVDNGLKTTIRNLAGEKREEEIIKQQGTSRIAERIEKFMQSQVYGKHEEDAGQVLGSKVSVNKLGHVLLKINSIKAMSFNFLLGQINLLQGRINMRLEAIAGEFFTHSDCRAADKIIASNIASVAAEAGNRIKFNKLSLFGELFDTRIEGGRVFRFRNYDRKTWMSRMLGDSLYFATSCGDYYTHTRTALALANRYKLKDKSGNDVSLWDALEVVPIDPLNPEAGNRIQIATDTNGNPLYTKEDGSPFDINDIIAFTRKSAALNERQHGIYNEADKNMAQQYIWGQMFMQFRGWLVPGIHRRFGKLQRNEELGTFTEGYYRTAYGPIIQFVKDLRKGIPTAMTNIALNYKNMTDIQKMNIRRAIAETAIMLLLTILANWGFSDDDDDEEDSWMKEPDPDEDWFSYKAYKNLEYTVRRLGSELNVLIPHSMIVNQQQNSLTEAFKMFDSPVACMSTLKQIQNLLGFFDPDNYEMFNGEDAIISRGVYDGFSKVEKIFINSPFAGGASNIVKFVNPEEALDYYKN